MLFLVGRMQKKKTFPDSEMLSKSSWKQHVQDVWHPREQAGFGNRNFLVWQGSGKARPQTLTRAAARLSLLYCK